MRTRRASAAQNKAPQFRRRTLHWRYSLFAFVLVSLGVVVLRRKQPDRPRGFKVPMVPLFPMISVVLCGGLMTGLTVITWIRFFVWLAIGMVIYWTYSRRHSEFAKR